jgi:hypothetical protein
MEIESILDLVDKRDILKGELRMAEQDLAQALWGFEGSVKDALIAGIVRPNFSAPAGFNRMLANERDTLRR